VLYLPLLYCGGQADHYHLEQVPLEQYFPEYTGGSDINKATKYILWKFMQANRARLSVYPQYVAPFFVFLLSALTLVSLTQATDITNIQLIFAVVKETALQNELKNSRIL
jgi:guanine nucleotide-binding protein G(i) subunit alpha